MKKLNNQKGFTLTEVLVVITILVIIGLAALINFDPLQQFFKGYDTIRKNDLSTLKTAFENYYADKQCYPPETILTQCGSNSLSPYLEKIPCDPNGQPYTGHFLPEESENTCPQNYAIYASLSNKVDTQGDNLEYCENTLAVTSPGMTSNDTISGCSDVTLCYEMYGCRNGACTLLFQDTLPTCGFTYCDSNCNGVNCSQKNRRGSYVNECR